MGTKYAGINEATLKNRVAQDFFGKFDCTEIIKDIDFSAKVKRTGNFTDLHTDFYLLWAEAKIKRTDVSVMLAQLVLTVGKARTFDKILPPAYLGCFDCDKIAFIEYHEIQEIFYVNDFNWNVAPHDANTKEFKRARGLINKIDKSKTFIFDFEEDEKELKTFIKNNFDLNVHPVRKIQIDKNNFITIYNKWLEKVKPSIDIDWAKAKKYGLIDGDFYLADLLSDDNKTIREKLSVLLKTNHYEADRHFDKRGMLTFSTADFKDGQKAHTQFWAVYERPPKTDYWDYIVNRRDLLVPQDIRERRGSFFTPQIWVELSQKYIADVLGEDWQDEYYVWDCAAGTGNLLAGLTNKYNIYASTLDTQDVDVMHDRIENGANLLKDHCFRFDFLNDEFDKLPKGLQKIIKNTPEKLVVYINPPYAEAGSVSVIGDRKNKEKVSTETKICEKYRNKLGLGIRELFAQFLIRAHQEIRHCKIANFSKLKTISGDGFKSFREFFQARFVKGFCVPANTFDNVDGKFPIGFHIWDTGKKEQIKKCKFDVYCKDKLERARFIGKKSFYSYDDKQRITEWISKFDVKNKEDAIGYTGNNGPDFQNNNYCHINGIQKINKNGTLNNATKYSISINNLIPVCIYFTVRHCIEATWLNDRDQFLYPNNKWKKDIEFQNDCLAFTLFHNSNNISAAHGVNHWIPFFEKDVNAREKFDSHFMMSFISGKIIQNGYTDLFVQQEDKMCMKREFSTEAKAVFDAGKELWKYYHSKPRVNVNASFYDIREYFQGRNAAGRMNSKSEDEKYTELVGELRERLKVLAKRIEPKVYEYGFLRD